MKKQIFRTLALLLLVSCCSWPVTAQKNANQAATKGDAPEIICPAPAPGYFQATNVTPFSVTLAWGPGAVPPITYYRLDGFDNTTSMPLATVHTTALTYTYTGLTQGHNYTYSNSASYCQQGPRGHTMTANITTGIIIVDEIDGIYECTPNSQPSPIGRGTKVSVGIQASTNPPAQGLNNAFTAEFSYEGNLFRFALAFDAANSRVYKEVLYNPSELFDFASTNNGASAICKFQNGNGDITIFTLNFVNFFTGPNQVKVELSFAQSVSAYSCCGNIALPGIQNEEDDSNVQKIYREKVLERSSSSITGTETQFRPNPFAQNGVFEYTLAQESPVHISLTAATGRLIAVVEETTLKAAGTHQVLIVGTGLPGGGYFLRAQTRKECRVFTLVKKE